MLSTSFNSATVFLLNDEPDWSTPPRVRVTVPAQRNRGLTGREARRALGETLRWELDWSATLDRDATNLLRAALQSLGDEALVCPLWPFALPGADWAGSGQFTGPLIGWLSDWSDFEIGSGITPGDWDWVAPVLFGKLAQTPRVNALGTEHATASFSFHEDSDATSAVTPNAVTFTNGPALGDSTVPKIFPVDVNWKSAPAQGAAAEVMIERQAIGSGRTRASEYYPQSAERPLEAALLLNGAAEIASLLRWWLDRRASVEAHYVVAAGNVATLAANAAAGNNTITLTDATDLAANRFLELTNGFTREIVRVASIAGNVCTLTANLAANWNASTTLVRLAMLARHATDALEMDFASPLLAHSRATWRELPAEYTIASGETRGTSVGAQTTKTFLYEVTLDWNGATETHRFTGYERDVTASAQTWTARKVEHSELRQSLALDRDETTLKVRWWSGCPFRVFLPNALEAKVTLKIYECDMAGGTGSNVAQIFGGEITAAPMDGAIITATAAGANALFDRKFPRMLLQTRCNHALFDARCGLTRADWTAGATVYALSGATVTLETFTWSGSTPAGFGFAHWFALGYLQRTVSGVPQRHLVFDSAAKDGSNRILITLGAAPSPVFTVGETVSIVPGCDNAFTTCQAYDAGTNPTGKFNNAAKFGGFPLLPDKNPSFQPLKKTDSTTGKK